MPLPSVLPGPPVEPRMVLVSYSAAVAKGLGLTVNTSHELAPPGFTARISRCPGSPVRISNVVRDCGLLTRTPVAMTPVPLTVTVVTAETKLDPNRVTETVAPWIPEVRLMELRTGTKSD